MRAKLVAVVVPVTPAVTVLKAEVSKVILKAFLVIDNNCLFG